MKGGTVEIHTETRECGGDEESEEEPKKTEIATEANGGQSHGRQEYLGRVSAEHCELCQLPVVEPESGLQRSHFSAVSIDQSAFVC
jgi:hypothetical protein